MESMVNVTLRFLVILLALSLTTIAPVAAVPVDSEGVAKELISIGEPGPEAIKFKVWTNKEEGEVFRAGDRAIIFLTADRQAYLTIVAISSDGSVTVFLPNEFMRDNMIQPHKLYTLFGDDWPVRLTAGEMPGNEKLLICLSSAPLTLDPLKMPEGARWLTIAADAGKEKGILKEKLRAIAQDKSFNRAVLSLPREAGATVEFQLGEAPRRLKRKALPADIESTIPDPVTGTAGVKPPKKGNLKQ